MMKKYIGTKLVQATPAIRKGGKIYLPTDAIPKAMEPVEEGYKVKTVMKAGHLKMSLKRLITWLIPLLTVCISNIMS